MSVCWVADLAPKVAYDPKGARLNQKSLRCKMDETLQGAGFGPTFPPHHLRAGVSGTPHPARVS
jgi:hypothetical protein